MPGVGWFSHWPEAKAVQIVTARKTRWSIW
jgi:hypothetical protein